MQPVQPLWQGLYPRGAHLYRRPVQKVRRLLHHRRGIRAHRLRAPRARLYGHAARHVRANHQLQLAVQDLLHHRLASGLHYRPCRNHRAHQEGPRLPHRRRRRSPARGRRHRPQLRRQLLPGGPRPLHRQARPILSGTRQHRPHAQRAAGRLLRDDGHL